MKKYLFLVTLILAVAATCTADEMLRYAVAWMKRKKVYTVKKARKP